MTGRTERFSEELRIPPAAESLAELFHENSKLSPMQPPLMSDEGVVARMGMMDESLTYLGAPSYPLPGPEPLPRSLEQALLHRVSTRELAPCRFSLRRIGTLLHYAYGITRDNAGTEFLRGFRSAPSGGGLYPLELYVVSDRIEGLPAALFHYSPVERSLRVVRPGDHRDQVAAATIYADMVAAASAIVIVTALFERTTFKYGDRGYRFALIEAGHVGQNLNLVAASLDIGCLDLGGYFDRQMDGFLGIDGVTHSTIYCFALGGLPRADRGALGEAATPV